jgi:hypothetical protein
MSEELAAAMKRIGELTMENGVNSEWTQAPPQTDYQGMNPGFFGSCGKRGRAQPVHSFHRNADRWIRRRFGWNSLSRHQAQCHNV